MPLSDSVFLQQTVRRNQPEMDLTSSNKVTLLDTKDRLATFTPDDSNPHLTYEWIRSVRSIGEEKFLTRDLHYWQSKLKGSSTKLLVAFKDRDNMPSMEAFLVDVETSFGYMDEHLLYSIWQKLERGKLGYEGYWELLHAHLNDWESSSAKSEADRYGMSIFPSPALIMYKFQQGIPRCDYNDLQKFGKHLLSDREQLDWLMRHGSLKRSGSVDHDASLLAVCRLASKGARDLVRQIHKSNDVNSTLPAPTRTNKRCNYCRRIGHLRADCRKLKLKKPTSSSDHDSGKKVDSNATKPSSNSNACSFCKNQGHPSERCREKFPHLKEQYLAARNATSSPDGSSKKSATAVTNVQGVVAMPSDLPVLSKMEGCFASLDVKSVGDIVQLTFYLDSGATYSMASPSAYAELSPRPKLVHLAEPYVLGLSATATAVQSTMYFEMTVGIDPYFEVVTAFLVDGLPADLVLSRRDLRKMNADLKYSTDQLVIKDKSRPLLASPSPTNGTLLVSQMSTAFKPCCADCESESVAVECACTPDSSDSDSSMLDRDPLLTLMLSKWKKPSRKNVLPEGAVKIDSPVGTIIVGKKLSTAELEELLELLEKRKGVFSATKLGIVGCAECVHEITLKPGDPCRQYSRIVRDPVMREVDRVFTKHGVASDWLVLSSKSHGYCSRSFYISKTGQTIDVTKYPLGSDQFEAKVLSSYRKVVDLCFNKRVVPDAYPCPDALSTCTDVSRAGSIYWCTDLVEAYHQLYLALASRKYTEHHTSLGSVQYVKMPQGLVGASQRMARCQAALFGHLQNVFGFFDNNAGAAHTTEALLKNFSAFLEVCEKHNVKLKASDLMFGLNSLPWIGHLVQHKAVSVDPTMRAALCSMPFPMERSLVASFARSVGWMRAFLAPKFSKYAGVLLDYGNSKAKSQVTLTEAQLAFDEVQKLLRFALTLRPFDPSAPTEVCIDYSKLHVGAGLRQLFDDVWFPIFSFSRRLTVSERNSVFQNSTKGETIALVWSLRKLKPWLGSMTFNVCSDSGNLSWLKSSSSETAIRARSLLEKDYNLSQIRISHVRGKKNWADIISRDPTSEDMPQEQIVLAVASLSAPPVLTFSKNDFSADEIASYKLEESDSSVSVFWKGKVLVPRSQLSFLFERLHVTDTNHHLPLDVTEQRFKPYIWRGKSYELAAAWRSCKCRLSRGSSKAKWFTGYASRPLLPNSRWSIDFKGPLRVTPRGNRMVVGVADHATPLVLFWATPNATSADAIEALSVFMMTGMKPDTLVSDNAKAFLSTASPLPAT